MTRVVRSMRHKKLDRGQSKVEHVGVVELEDHITLLICCLRSVSAFTKESIVTMIAIVLAIPTSQAACW